MSYVTLWDCFEGKVRKRLKNEKDVCAIGISDDAQRILFGKGNCELRIWEPFKHNSLRKIRGYSGMNFQFGVNKIFMLKGGSQGIIYAGDISMWDLDKGTVLAVYTPDTRISAMTIAMRGQLLCFGLKDSLSVVSLRLIDNKHDSTKDQGENIMGEQVWSDSSDED